MSKAEKIICGGCFLLISIHLVASYFPSQRLWGVNLLYYVPPSMRWILVISSLLVLIPYVNRGLGGFLSRVSGSMASRFKRLNKYYKYGFFSLIGGAAFWMFKVKTYLLGDSFVRAREIDMGGKFSFTAPLDFLVHLKVARLSGWDAFQTYAILSVLSGTAFVFLVLLLADMIGKDGKERFLISAVILTMGANQLFFGYVETYSLLYLTTFVYILLCLSYLNNRGGLVFPLLSFLVAVGLHLSAVTLLPSFLYLIFSRRSVQDKSGKEESKLFRPVLFAATVLAVGAGFLLLQKYNLEKSGLGYFLIFPLGSGESSYSLFSFAHLLDLFNHQLLVSPVGVVILLTAVWAFPRRISIKDGTVGFLVVLSVCTLAYAFLVDPKLGYGRDWDLFAFSGLGYTVLGLYLLLKRGGVRKTDSLRYAALTLLFASLISTVPWIYVNAREDSAVARFEHLLKLDVKRSGYGRETLAMHYNMRGQWQKEIEQWEKAIAVTNSARYMNNLAAVYNQRQRYDLALKYLERSLEVDSTFDYTHFSMGDVLSRLGRYQEAIAQFRKAIELRPDRVEYYRNLGAHLGNLGRDQEAIEVLQQGLRRHPGYFPMYRDLGYVYFNSGNYSQAEKYLKLYLDYLPGAEDEAQVRQLLKNLRQRSRPVTKP
ncbi:MAG: tetratricopeptide repeat protein [candidate division Zixibacteria bacterium]|nr:tetratricopeptide repeat protein [candidate division Zixibacteria bacterium]